MPCSDLDGSAEVCRAIRDDVLRVQDTSSHSQASSALSSTAGSTRGSDRALGTAKAASGSSTADKAALTLTDM